MQATTVLCNTGLGYNIICRSELPFVWQHHVCPDYKIPPVGFANRNILQISSTVILHIRFGRAVYETILALANYVGVILLTGTRIVSRLVNPNRCIDRQLEFTKGKKLLRQSASNEPRVERLESMTDNYSAPPVDTPTTMIDYYPDIMHLKDILCKHVIRPAYIQVRLNVTKISGLIYTESKTFQ